ncbi:EAL domain-containing protein [Magnetovirga frankeli]|uniref:EAL domain-containing protein n=1 Tax=Magnetovirga frankeli TaxID=947516 RepID=UPI001293AAB4|nr:EAL domain-containing protein [gamma proteobacterium SS-5]
MKTNKTGKIFSAVVVLFILLVVAKQVFEYRNVSYLEEKVIREESKSLRAFLTAFRQTYQKLFLTDHVVELNEQTLPLLPAVSIGQISKEFGRLTGRRASLATVSDRPRNPENRADLIEQKAIDYFRANPDQEEYFSRTADGRQLFFASPIRIKKHCLKCHGNPSETLDWIRKQYDTAFGYREGDLRGVVSIKIDGQPLRASLLQDYFTNSLFTLFIGLLFLSGIFLLVRRINAQDVLFQNSLERKIQERTKDLALASRIIENSVESIMVTDTQRRIVSVNNGFEKATGYRREEVLGKSPSLLSSGWHGPEFFTEMEREIQQQGYWEGELYERRKNGEIYVSLASISAIQNEAGEVEHYVAISYDITEKKAREDEIYHLAYYDPLTKLPNRRNFTERLDQAIILAQRKKHQLALLLLDLDNFKYINDTLGHIKGDQFLQQVAGDIDHILQGRHLLARFGGDEFAILVEAAQAQDVATRICQGLLECCARPVDLEGKQIFSGASIGISVYPADGEGSDELIKRADTAMYFIKAREKNGYKFFNEAMNQESLDKLDLISNLKTCISKNELELYYQPKIELSTGRILGMEALVRWHSKKLGLVAPYRFIPVAEECGMIREIGRWVLQEACRQTAAWLAEGWPLKVAVNVSAVEMRDPQFAENTLALLRRMGFATEYLELEVTESAIIEDTDRVIEILSKLQEAGVDLAIDDFGTGYSSMNHLKRLPIDNLKIDKSFIDDITLNMEDQVIVKAIVAMARSLGLAVVAEGVEHDGQQEILRQIGCDYIQGYLHSKPLPAADFLAFLQDRDQARQGDA